MADLGIPGGLRIVHRDKRLAGKILVVEDKTRLQPVRLETMRDQYGQKVRDSKGQPIMRPRADPLISAKLGRRWVPTYKTYVLRLDGQASILVSHTVWDGIKRIPNAAGFQLESDVADPPPVNVGAGNELAAGHPVGLESDVRADADNDVPADALVLERS